MNIIIKRLLADTPSFFKKIIALMVSVGAIGAALLVPDVAAQLPPIFGKLAGYMVTAGVVGGVLAKLTVKDPEALK